MNELDKAVSLRLRTALEYLQLSGQAETQSEIARRIGVSPSSLNMAANGTRFPGYAILLALSDSFPISFDWLRTGNGRMKGDRIAELRREVKALQEENEKLRNLLKKEQQRLQNACNEDN